MEAKISEFYSINTFSFGNFFKELGLSCHDLNKINKNPFYALKLTGGTEFQQKVWREILNIKKGEVKTYSEIAILCGSPKAFRAVALCCAQNPFPILIPCHRVVGKNGFGGYTVQFKSLFNIFGVKHDNALQLKQLLLDMERRKASKGRVAEEAQ